MGKSERIESEVLERSGNMIEEDGKDRNKSFWFPDLPQHPDFE
jgi:hypothetical protein